MSIAGLMQNVGQAALSRWRGVEGGLCFVDSGVNHWFSPQRKCGSCTGQGPQILHPDGYFCIEEKNPQQLEDSPMSSLCCCWPLHVQLPCLFDKQTTQTPPRQQKQNIQWPPHIWAAPSVHTCPFPILVKGDTIVLREKKAEPWDMLMWRLWQVQSLLCRTWLTATWHGRESLHLSRSSWVQNCEVQMERDLRGSNEGRNYHWRSAVREQCPWGFEFGSCWAFSVLPTILCGPAVVSGKKLNGTWWLWEMVSEAAQPQHVQEGQVWQYPQENIKHPTFFNEVLFCRRPEPQ